MKDGQAATTGHEGGRGERLRARLGRLRGARRRSLLALPELLALAAAALLLLAALGAYFLLLRPQRARLEELRAERERLGRQLEDAKTGVKRSENTQASVREILESLQDFEGRHLGVNERGSTGVIEELNRLIRRNNLRISGGLTFTPLEETVPGQEQQQPQPQRTARRMGKIVQSVFPGIGITLTVEGTYAGMRRFIRDVEASRQFIVIDAVELEGVTDTAPRNPLVGVPGEAGAVPQPPARGTLVSLRLDMAAYFRRAGVPAPSGGRGGTR